ncbi:MAG: TonB-dependent receptor, partial [Pseudomonadota bacterium]
YNHAILSSRASGTGNSARSAVYADGILLSNFLGNGVGGLAFPPRWGLVTPEEIGRVDVMYGPFSAAYPGNSVGAVVEYVTRMPTRFEAHGAIGVSLQPFTLFGTEGTARSRQASASAGNRSGDWSWFFNASQTDSESQPLTFATRLVSAGTAAGTGVPVTGAVPDRNSAGVPWYLIGSGTAYRTRQDHLKAKLAYDITPTLRAAYTLGTWSNSARGEAVSFLRDAAGRVVESGAVRIDGRGYTLSPADFARSSERSTHVMHGVSVKSRTQGAWDWEASASLYDYRQDLKRQSTGTLADGAGSGWNTLALRGTWRPGGMQGPHVVDFGVQQASYVLDYRTSALAGDWQSAAPGPLASEVAGRTRLRSLWAQDAWAFAERWKAVLGLRAERWEAFSGTTRIAAATPAIDTAWPARRETYLSPKAALSWQWRPDTVLKAALGRAVRMPTVAELYGATSTADAQFINDPTLRPERSWTGELSAEKDLGNALLRLTLFAEDTRDALFSQTLLDTAAGRNVTRVQNVGRIATRGIEVAYSGADVGARGLDLGASLTYADSVIKQNAGFVAVPGDTIGKRQPNVARWRASALASYRWSPQWATSLGARYSGPQFRTLNNGDVNGFTYMGVSRFFVVNARARWQVSRTTSAALGIDNLNNAKYWNFHPYPQRTYVAELKVDL